jgi:hypothetical protein
MAFLFHQFLQVERLRPSTSLQECLSH